MSGLVLPVSILHPLAFFAFYLLFFQVFGLFFFFYLRTQHKKAFISYSMRLPLPSRLHRGLFFNPHQLC